MVDQQRDLFEATLEEFVQYVVLVQVVAVLCGHKQTRKIEDSLRIAAISELRRRHGDYMLKVERRQRANVRASIGRKRFNRATLKSNTDHYRPTGGSKHKKRW